MGEQSCGGADATARASTGKLLQVVTEDPVVEQMNLNFVRFPKERLQKRNYLRVKSKD